MNRKIFLCRIWKVETNKTIKIVIGTKMLLSSSMVYGCKTK
jgi:hypothetical protein